jgi:hypothetical protein
MGLAQKRIAKEFEDKEFPAWKAEFDAIVGFNMSMEVHWDTMQHEDYGQNYRDDYFKWYKQVYFKPLAEAFRKICRDDMGKAAVKDGVKKIIIDGREGSGAYASSFVGGEFTINHRFNCNVDDEKERAEGWQKMIENRL